MINMELWFIGTATRMAGSLMAHWFTVVAAILLPLLLYYLGTRETRRLKAAFGNMPGPKLWPFVGILVDAIKFKGQSHLQFDSYYKMYGRVFPITLFGYRCLVVGDPEMVKQILVKDFEAFSERLGSEQMPDPLNKMLTRARGSTWKRIRNTLSPTFTALKMKLMLPLMNEACDILMAKLSEMADTGKSFDIPKFHKCLTIDIILSTAFGVHSDCQNNAEDPFMTKGKAVMSQNPAKGVALVLLGMLPFGSRLCSLISKWAFSELFDMFDIAQEVINLRRTNPGGHRMDMLELMLHAENPETHTRKLTDTEVMAQCVVFIVAGYETTSTTLALTCYHLASHPEVQRKLQKEIDEVWPEEDQVSSYDNIRELAYLDMVISETLRIYPLGFTLGRLCTKEIAIKGVKIPKDTAIWIPVYSMQHDPEFYPDPDKFDPERFSAEAKQSRDPYTYLPFGHGPHNCIGMRFAQMEMKLVLARILRKFGFVLDADASPPNVGVRTILTALNGVTLKLVTRK